jgi:hypothetical protein
MTLLNVLRIGLLVFLSTIFLSGEDIDKRVEAGFKSISPMRVYNYCKTMASEKYQGRFTGHQGYTEAAEWAAGYFREWGLRPITEKTEFLQPYSSPYVIIESADMTLFLDNNKSKVPLILEKDYLPLLFSDSGDKRAALVFVGWGICAPDLGYDDYADIDVKGKFVLCFRGTPDRENKKFQPYDYHRFRMKTAKEKGSLGIFYIYKEPLSNPNGDWIEEFTPAIISYNIADRLLKEKGLTAEALRKKLVSTKKSHSFELQSEVHFKLKSKYFPKGVGYNVAGYIEGSDPKLKKECLVIGGHFDHNGVHMGLLFPGANDNASGSAVVMEIARAFSAIEIPPKRSVVFVLFGGEEMGLMGSTYFANHLPKPFNKVDTMFNFDMVGEGDGTVCVMSPKPKGLEETLKNADLLVSTLKRVRYLRHVGVRGSDFTPFFHKGAACISFFSNGPHLHYHKTNDTIYRVNPDIMADIAKLAFLTAYKWADR